MPLRTAPPSFAPLILVRNPLNFPAFPIASLHHTVDTVTTGVVATGVAFGDDGFLYITGSENVCRVRISTKVMKSIVL